MITSTGTLLIMISGSEGTKYGTLSSIIVGGDGTEYGTRFSTMYGTLTSTILNSYLHVHGSQSHSQLSGAGGHSTQVSGALGQFKELPAGQSGKETYLSLRSCNMPSRSVLSITGVGNSFRLHSSSSGAVSSYTGLFSFAYGS